jgi:Flp pilus assembly pilin Flp
VLRDESGATAIEWVFLGAFASIGALGAIELIGPHVSAVFR